jgi:hypothetical protein
MASPETSYNPAQLSEVHARVPLFCSFSFERDLLRYMEQLIREMDVKIRKNKERADAESRPKVLKLDDQKRLDEIKARQAGRLRSL